MLAEVDCRHVYAPAEQQRWLLLLRNAEEALPVWLPFVHRRSLPMQSPRYGACLFHGPARGRRLAQRILNLKQHLLRVGSTDIV